MNIWNKILVGLIGVVSVVLFYMAARTMKTHQYWRELAQNHVRKIAQVEEENQKLVNGVENQGEQMQMGIRQLRVALSKLLLDRRRAWFKCDPKVELNREDGSATITVTTDKPDSHGIAENTILYGFEEADVRKKGRYLGEFKVGKADEKQKQVVLTPTSRLSPREIDRLAAAKGPWTLYEIMPRDSHDVYASLSDEQKKAMLPADSLPEYLKDGKPAAGDDPADRVAAGKYVRPLRDYQVLFSADRARATLLADQVDAATRDKKLIDDALAQAKQQEEAAKQDLAAAKEDVKKFTRERDAVATYRKVLDQELGAVKAAITELIKANQDMAGRIAQLQLEAARRIDERTRAMAQSGAGS